MLTKMNDKMVALVVTVKCLLMREEGQDLVEYALLVALIALACTAGMKTLSNSINAAFSAIGTSLTGYTG